MKHHNDNVTPPESLLCILGWFCPDDFLEQIEGDLVEKYKRDFEKFGERRAKRRFLWNLVGFFRPGIILRNKFSLTIINRNMIRNYFKIASRNIAKRKLYSVINAIGLSLGIAFCMLIHLFIEDEKSFDQFHVNKSDIYRINNKRFDFRAFKGGEKDPFSHDVNMPSKLGEVMLEEMGQVKSMTRYVRSVGGFLRYNEKVFTQSFTAVDSGFFEMFSFTLLAGNPDIIFDGGPSIVLTPKVAEKYFGTENPIGKLMTLGIGKETIVTVVGVIEAPPANSSLNFEVLIPVEKVSWFKSTWDDRSYATFVQLYPKADLPSLKRDLNQLYTKYVPDNREFRESEKIPDEYQMNELHFTKLTEIHLDTKIKWERSSDPKYSLILGGIALLILVIACINYICLALTSSANRRTEVGIRKVSGAFKAQLMIQFSMESILLAFGSTLIALILVVLFLSSFNSFTNKGIEISAYNWFQHLSIALIIICIVGLVAGAYPAFYLSNLKPTSILKGRFTAKANTWFAKPLVVIQFALSAFLIMSAVIMYKQMKFITTKDLGYDQHQVLFIPTQQESGEGSDRFVANFRSAVSSNPRIESVAGTSIPFTYGTMTMGFEQDDEFKVASGFIVDPAYIPALQIQLVAGRNFKVDNPADMDGIIVNETLVRNLKWTDPLSEHLNWRRDTVGLGSRVIGVVKDHHYLSLERSIEPMFLTLDKTFGHYQYILVRIASDDIPGTIQGLARTYKSLAPDKPFEYIFLDENVQLQYQSYERWMNIMSFATGFAILISCLGLFGLAGMNVVNRTKEIGIRKILGAELGNIFMLLNKQFVWLSVIAFAAAVFPAWYIMRGWLDSFHFKIELSWVIFAVSIAAGLIITLLTTSYHTIKAGMVNASDTLRHE
ncbi:MAG: ABC transporter permease [Chryseosolibacter sp.]